MDRRIKKLAMEAAKEAAKIAYAEVMKTALDMVPMANKVAAHLTNVARRPIDAYPKDGFIAVRAVNAGEYAAISQLIRKENATLRQFVPANIEIKAVVVPDAAAVTAAAVDSGLLKVASKLMKKYSNNQAANQITAACQEAVAAFSRTQPWFQHNDVIAPQDVKVSVKEGLEKGVPVYGVRISAPNLNQIQMGQRSALEQKVVGTLRQRGVYQKIYLFIDGVSTNQTVHEAKNDEKYLTQGAGRPSLSAPSAPMPQMTPQQLMEAVDREVK
jgi:hypothetical protein